jgi:predicted Zn-dependent protease
LTRRPDDRHKPKGAREGRHGAQQRHSHRTITSVTSGQLPKWVRDEIVRSTPKDRREPALMHLSKAMGQFADERYKAALPDLRQAKKLSPRSSTVRELLGLAAYRSGQWEEGLRELRTFRRITGDLIHMPVEMDCLRALGRKEDVTKTWQRIQEHDVSSTINHEARVVYASFLLDEGKPREAWPIIKPGRLVASPSPGELRRWYVAARVAIEAGDKDAARRIVAALDEQEVDFEGVDELRQALL